MICIDASVVAKWFLLEEWTDLARALLRDTLFTDETIVAQTLLPYELTNIFYQRLRAGGSLSFEESLRFLEDFLRIPIELHNPVEMHRRALILTNEHGLSAAYDAHYLALAEQFACVLWTDDRRLLRTPEGRLPSVRSISDYAMAG